MAKYALKYRIVGGYARHLAGISSVYIDARSKPEAKRKAQAAWDELKRSSHTTANLQFAGLERLSEEVEWQPE